jgi:hypothetical protein
MITRKNSRHPLFLVGLIALGISILSWRIVPNAIQERVQIRSQAVAIVEHKPVGEAPVASVGPGIYLALLASGIITAFGLTIVVKRVSTAYVVVDPNDDV